VATSRLGARLARPGGHRRDGGAEIVEGKVAKRPLWAL
jgi:hypothetical protein